MYAGVRPKKLVVHGLQCVGVFWQKHIQDAVADLEELDLRVSQ